MQEHFMVLRILLTVESGRKAQYYFLFFMKWIFIFNLVTFTRKKYMIIIKILIIYRYIKYS